MADDFESRMKAWEARMAARREEERTGPVAEPPLALPVNARGIALGTGTNILVFPAGFERQFDQHVALTRELKRAGVYPPLRVYGLVAQAADAPAARLVLITGSAVDVRKLAEVFYTPQAEQFVARRCGNDWDAINPAASIADVADPGVAVDRRTFDAVVAEIRGGRYAVAVELP